MDKQYRYTLRKTTLGLASVAIAAFLAGQAPTVLGAEEAEHVVNETVLSPEETAPPLEEANHSDTLSLEKEGASNAEITPMSETSELLEDENTPSDTVGEGPNYAQDEANIEDFSADERYRSTQLEQGNGPNFLSDAPELDYKDGYRYKTLEPAATSPDKRKWGFEIEFDKEKGQRTYTGFYFTNSGLLAGVLDVGNVPAKSPESGGLGESFKTPNYKAETE